MKKARVVVDFNNQDVHRRLRLDCSGTLRDLERQQIQLSEGLPLTSYDDDSYENGWPEQLVAEGVVEYSSEEQTWVARIDWDAVQHVTEQGVMSTNGAVSSSEPSPKASDRTTSG